VTVVQVSNPATGATGTTGTVSASGTWIAASAPTALATTGAGGDLGLLVMAGLLTLLGLSMQRLRPRKRLAAKDAYTPVFSAERP